MLKYVVALLVLIGVLVALSAIMGGKSTDAPSNTANESDAHRRIDRPSAWTFEEAGEIDGIPQTRVAVDLHDQFVPLGVFEGNCGDMQGSAWKLVPGATEGVICWFAGGGTEIAVFHDGDKHIIKSAALEEGTAEVAGFRGEFVTMVSI